MSKPTDATPAELIADADALLTEAESRAFDNKPGRSTALALKANRLRIRAARMMPPGPDRLALLLEIAFTGDALGEDGHVTWAVRQAVECGPDDDQMESLRDYWECWGWTSRGDRKFPEPAAECDRPWVPAPGQMSFLED